MSVVNNLIRVGSATFDFANELRDKSEEMKALDYGDALSRAMTSATIMMLSAEIMRFIEKDLGKGKVSSELNTRILELVQVSLNNVLYGVVDGEGESVCDFIINEIGFFESEETIH